MGCDANHRLRVVDETHGKVNMAFIRPNVEDILDLLQFGINTIAFMRDRLPA
jgi:hypothetical protein